MMAVVGPAGDEIVATAGDDVVPPSETLHAVCTRRAAELVVPVCPDDLRGVDATDGEQSDAARNQSHPQVPPPLPLTT